jgi:RNA recognition motif-containing protein
MIMNIYVGNLSWKAKKSDLENLFAHFGTVSRAFIVRDKKTKRSRGFGFVEFEDDAAGKAAIESLNNTLFMERPLVVNEAKPKEEAES